MTVQTRTQTAVPTHAATVLVAQLWKTYTGVRQAQVATMRAIATAGDDANTARLEYQGVVEAAYAAILGAATRGGVPLCRCRSPHIERRCPEHGNECLDCAQPEECEVPW